MHYRDEYQVENNILKIGIYIHEVLGTDETQLEISSIHECRFIVPYCIKMLIDNPHEELMKYDEIKACKTETFYLVTFKENENGDLEIKDISRDPLGLH
jgi:hypothetical protein